MFSLNHILSGILVLVCVFLTIVVLMQEGKSNGLGSISGMADSYWGKSRGRSVEGILEKLTRVSAVLFVVLSLVLNVVK